MWNYFDFPPPLYILFYFSSTLLRNLLNDSLKGLVGKED